MPKRIPSLFTFHHNILVCNTGYYKNGIDCVMCTGNTIKPMVGDVTTCSISCDGKMKVANLEHTACGMSIMNPHLHTIAYQLCFRHSNHNKCLKRDIHLSSLVLTGFPKIIPLL